MPDMPQAPDSTSHAMTEVELDDQHDPRQLRNALGRFPTGVTVITTRTPEGKAEGLTANSFSALSLDPPLVLWSINRKSLSLPSFLSAGYFAINVLRANQSELSHRFATARENKFEEVVCTNGRDGCPVLGGVLATFECQTERTIDGGDHVLFVGRVKRITYGEGDPLIFSAGRYATVVTVGTVGTLSSGTAESDLNGIWAGLG